MIHPYATASNKYSSAPRKPGNIVSCGKLIGKRLEKPWKPWRKWKVNGEATQDRFIGCVTQSCTTMLECGWDFESGCQLHTSRELWRPHGPLRIKGGKSFRLTFGNPWWQRMQHVLQTKRNLLIDWLLSNGWLWHRRFWEWYIIFGRKTSDWRRIPH